MRNCRKELEEHTHGKEILCCLIVFVDEDDEYSDEQPSRHMLRIGFSAEELFAFLESLDFYYYAGYEAQNLFGTIWYTDGTWSERGEYDGSKWWEYKKSPEIPDCLKGGF